MKDNNILKSSLSKGAKIILPEDNDPRVKDAILKLQDLGFNIINPSFLKEKKTVYKDIILKKKFTKNWTEKTLNNFLKNPINLSFIALLNGDVDCSIAGATVPTSEVIRSSLRIVGLKKSVDILSSSFFMVSQDSNIQYTYSDCAVIPEPNVNQLCSIAYEASVNHKLLSNTEPKVVFLSFSTMGSSEHYKVKKMQDAAQLFNKKHPDIICDGEMQFDAAINSEIALKKNANNIIKGDANVFVFPDLDSGNIAYKITQHLSGYSAWGPLLQGLNKPIHDLSRGCTVDDIAAISMIAALQTV